MGKRVRQPIVKSRMMLVLLLLVMPLTAQALGLGNIQVKSVLNQPFKAHIQLLSATNDDVLSLDVVLADREAFERAGISRSDVLRLLRFSIKETDDEYYIQISSYEPIREPIINFLLEINWDHGLLFREYTALLDPPIYVLPSSVKPPIVISPLTSETEATDKFTHTSSTEQFVAPAGSSTRPYFGSGEYGPARTGDTLWAIAMDAKRDSSITIQQMMLAILHTNPDAFIKNNINGLKRGAILKIPDVADTDLAQPNAFAQVKEQNALWDVYRGNILPSVIQQPVESSIKDDSLTDEPTQFVEDTLIGEDEEISEESRDAAPIQETIVPPDATEIESTEATQATIEPDAVETETATAELQIISQPLQTADGEQGVEELTGVNAGALNDELALTNESIEVLSMANLEMQDRLNESKEIISDLDRLMVIKQDQLAAMQEQLLVGEANKQEIETETEAIENDDVIGEQIPVANGSFSLKNLVSIIQSNLLLVAGAIGALLLLFSVVLFLLKKRKQKAEELDFFSPNSLGPIMANDSASQNASSADGNAENIVVDVDDFADVDVDVASLDLTTEQGRSDMDDDPMDDDPMEEVNIFLAYEHFDEAETFIRNALETAPENLDFHLKLLEVFYAAGNKRAYEEAARAVYQKSNGSGEYWDMVTVMWQELSPNRDLFDAPTEEEDFETASSGSGGGNDLVNLTGKIEESNSSALEQTNVLEQTQSMSGVTANTDTDEIELDISDSGDASIDMDISLDMADEESADESIEISLDSGNEDDSIDMDISLDMADEESADESIEISLDSGDEDDSIDMDISLDMADESVEMSLDSDDEDDSIDMDISLDMADESIEMSLDSDDEDDSIDMDISLDMADAGKASADNLDVTAAMDVEEIGDDGLLDIELNEAVVDSDIEIDLGDLESNVEDQLAASDMPSLLTENISGLTEEDMDDDKTFLMPRALNVKEQDEAEEMSSHLDLAKAYIELNDNESAKMILDEIIAQGGTNHREQATELLGQLGN